MDLYVPKESLDPVRVCMNGIEGGRESVSYDAPDLCLLSRGVESRFSAMVVAVETEDLLRECREVRLSSRGFMSGGNLVIFRNITARYIEIQKDSMCRPLPLHAK